MNCAVYYIVNNKTNTYYIGSTNNKTRRLARHKSELKTNRHSNAHIQRSYNLYGACCFEFGVLEYCALDDLRSTEQFYIDYFRSLGITLFNIVLEDVNRPQIGRKFSAESRQKISKALSNKVVSQEQRDYLSECAKRQWEDPNTREKLMSYHRSRTHKIKEPKPNGAIKKNYTFMLDGSVVNVFNLAQFCRDNGLKEEKMRDVYAGRRKSYKGWTKF